MYNSFDEMPVWQKAATAMQEAYKLADKLPGHEKYAMATQIRTAALSIPGNIAEAFGRQHKKDKQNFYYYSRGSAHEVISHLYCAVKVDYFEAPELKHTVQLCYEVIEALNKIIRSLD